MRKKLFYSFVVSALGLLIFFSNCSKNESDNKHKDPLQRLEFTEEQFTIEEGDFEDLYDYLAIEPESMADTMDIEFTSSNANTAMVTSSGKVLALFEGTTTITASAHGKTTSIDVKVTPVAITDFSVEGNVTAYVNVPQSLSINVEPTRASAGHLDVSVIEGNASVAFESNTWNFTATEAGTYHIKVKSSDKEEQITVKATVVEVTGITLNTTSIVVKKGSGGTLSATVEPGNASYPEITWQCSPSTIVTIDEQGNWHAVGNGTATVTARTSNGRSATCTIKVTESDPVESFDLYEEGKTITLNAYESYTATVTNIVPSTASKESIAWSTSNSSIAEVTNGVVTAKDIQGIVTITATSASMTKQFYVSVSTIDVTDVQFSDRYTTLYVLPGKTYTFMAYVYPSNATNKNLTIEKTSGSSSLTINRTGQGTGTETVKITIPENATGGTYRIKATSSNNKSDILELNVLTAAVALPGSSAGFSWFGTFGMTADIYPSNKIAEAYKSNVAFNGTSMDSYLTKSNYKTYAVWKSGSSYNYGFVSYASGPAFNETKTVGHYTATDYMHNSVTWDVNFKFTTSITGYLYTASFGSSNSTVCGQTESSKYTISSFQIKPTSTYGYCCIRIYASYYTNATHTSSATSQYPVYYAGSFAKSSTTRSITMWSDQSTTGVKGDTFSLIWK
ncbi:MAG: Ig-like domain-containing protein [Paludibacteraceae bacterium]|nr:Ig-like domain-containing protein [Paludibacteraceae bacterium]